MLSPEFQADIPLNMFVFPANSNAAGAGTCSATSRRRSSQPIEMDPAQIAANRDRWIQEWTDVVIH